MNIEEYYRAREIQQVLKLLNGTEPFWVNEETARPYYTAHYIRSDGYRIGFIEHRTMTLTFDGFVWYPVTACYAGQVQEFDNYFAAKKWVEAQYRAGV